MRTHEPKSCASCGRRIAWRKKWERDWEHVKYCSKSCRANTPGASDRALEEAVLSVLASRSAGASICPSEAARAVDPDGWRALMEPARRAARRLVARGQAVITQGGRPVDLSTARGPIRIRRP
ncbi:MAG: DUF3253 domain-containing protein [Phycisphaerales bacterium JB040]